VTPSSTRRVTRRQFLRGAAVVAGGAGLEPLPWPPALAVQSAACGEVAVGELVRTLPLYGPGANDVPLGPLFGEGLDARRYTDLSRLSAERMITPVAEMFVRTTAPTGLSAAANTWQIALADGEGVHRATVSVSDLSRDATPQGAHVIECAGNSNPQNFGLMSAVTWDGVPLSAVLARMARPAGATGVLVSGRDHDTAPSPQSLPGASWILPLADLDRLGAFLAVRLNDAPLTADHGAPVRLVVPGWYGCSWIKWVDRLQWVDDHARPTTQMLEFAFRTHQDAIPALARDYLAPEIDLAAMPVRVEQRRVDGRLEYRVVGITWGGARPVDQLVLRFGSRDAGVRVPVCPPSGRGRTWTLWTHRWRPTEPGYYDLTLKAADPSVRTRRLDLSFYLRRVRIDEI
jgi:DMSO/TMAO reductase YedYZ molybdopterin-dependent catalytic subunit